MANTTITDLPNATTPLGPEYIVLDQGGETKKLLLSDLFQTSGSETITSLTQNGNVLSYTNETGVVNTINVLEEETPETLTSLSLVNGVLSYTDEVAQTTNLTLIPDGSIGYAKLSLGAPAWDETGSVNAGGITISGHLSPTLSDADIGREVPRSAYANNATNLWLKGNSAGVSGIFFESDSDGFNINRESDGAYIQYHARGINNSPYSNTEERGDLIIGIANDDSEDGNIGVEDKIIFNIPGRNQLVTTYDAGVTEHKIWHAGNDGVDSGLNADLLDGQEGSYYASVEYANTISGITSVSYDDWSTAPVFSSEDYLISPVGFQPIIRGNISANRAAGTITIAEDGLYSWDFNCVVEPAISLGDFGGTHATANQEDRNCVMANYPGAVPTTSRIFGVIMEVNGTSTGIVSRFGPTVPTASNRLDQFLTYDKAWLQAGDVVKFIFVGQEYPSHATDADVRFDMTNSRFSFYQEA